MDVPTAGLNGGLQYETGRELDDGTDAARRISESDRTLPRVDSGALGIELGRETWLGIAVVDFELLKEQLPKARFVDSSPVVWGCRLIKSEWEIDCMRQACEIGGVAWHRAFQDLRPGMAASAVQKNVLRYYIEGGADLNSEPPMVLGATGPNRTFQKGDVLLIHRRWDPSGLKDGCPPRP